MKQIIRCSIGFVLMLFSVLSTWAQDETSAFYIYQNDGHFSAFFNDQVLKITYSKFDTLGVEYDDYVSQEIVTADSTYRIMLSAIDSVGFVQPEVKYNPRVRYIPRSSTETRIMNPDPLYSASYMIYNYTQEDNLMLEFYEWPARYTNRSPIPEKYYPKPGDVFVSFEPTVGFALKVVSVEKRDDAVVAHCTNIDDITDIFHQLILVEEYEGDREGNLIRRRVAGQPDKSIGFPKKASGSFEGDLFNFTLSGHIPLVNTDKLTVSVDPSLSASMKIKTTWDIPLIGPKYVSIEDQVNLQSTWGLTIDGKVGEVSRGGFGKFGQLPVPATAPILVIDLGPDGFFRGQADVKLNFTTPPSKACIWEKWEIVDWWPHYSHGQTEPDRIEDMTIQEFQEKTMKTFSLEGYLQIGVNFPIKVKSQPLLKKLFDASLGGDWYIGPKISGSVTVDLGTEMASNTSTYEQLKNTKLTLSPMDADYEIKAEVASLFSPKKEWTIVDGSFQLIAPMEICPVPDFGECEEKEEMRKINGKDVLCHILSYEPSGNIIKPLKVGVQVWTVEEDDGTVLNDGKGYFSGTQWRDFPYYQGQKQLGDIAGDDRVKKLEFVIPYTSAPNNGKFRVYPCVEFMNTTLIALPPYDFYEGAYLKTEQNELLINHDGTVDDPITFKGNCDGLIEYNLSYSPEDGKVVPDYISVTGKGDDLQLSVDKDEFIKKFGKNYSPQDTLKRGIDYIGNVYGLMYYGTRRITDDVTAKGYKEHIAQLLQLPNTKEDPVETVINTKTKYLWLTTPTSNITFAGLPQYGMTNTFERLGNRGWKCMATYQDADEDLSYEFDLIEDHHVWYIQNGKVNYRLTKTATDYEGVDHTITCTVSGTFGGTGEGDMMKLAGAQLVRYNTNRDCTSDLVLKVEEDDVLVSTQPLTGGMSLINVKFADALEN